MHILPGLFFLAYCVVVHFTFFRFVFLFMFMCRESDRLGPRGLGVMWNGGSIKEGPGAALPLITCRGSSCISISDLISHKAPPVCVLLPAMLHCSLHVRLFPLSFFSSPPPLLLSLPLFIPSPPPSISPSKTAREWRSILVQSPIQEIVPKDNPTQNPSPIPFPILASLQHAHTAHNATADYQTVEPRVNCFIRKFP